MSLKDTCRSGNEVFISPTLSSALFRDVTTLSNSSLELYRVFEPSEALRAEAEKVFVREGGPEIYSRDELAQVYAHHDLAQVKKLACEYGTILSDSQSN